MRVVNLNISKKLIKMGDVDELFSCFNDEGEDQQTIVPVVMETDAKDEQTEENS